MIGVRTDAGSTSAQLVYWTRFGELAAIVAAVFGGSILRRTAAAQLPPSRAGEPRAAAALRRPLATVRRLVASGAARSSRCSCRSSSTISAICSTSASSCSTYVMLGWGLNVVVGLAGLLDLGYVAFYAVGAYSYALLATDFDLSFWICLPLAGILAAFWGVLLGFPVLRLRGDYLAIVTLAFGEIIRLVLINWQSLTGGPNGITGIPRPTLLRHSASTPTEDGFAAALRHRVLADPPHRLPVLPDPGAGAAHQLGDDPPAPPADRPRLGGAARGRDRLPRARHQHHHDQAHGLRDRRDVRRLCRRVLRDAAGLHQPGILHVPWNRRCVLAIVVLGGMGSQLGVALAALAMIGGFELFRGLEQYRMLVFGMAMVLLMIWRPRGLIGHRAPTVFLERKTRRSRPTSSRRGTDERGDRHHPRRRRTCRCASAASSPSTTCQLQRRARQDHRADRPERRRQDHRVQLHHRLLQADRRHDPSSPMTTARHSCSSG